MYLFVGLITIQRSLTSVSLIEKFQIFLLSQQPKQQQLIVEQEEQKSKNFL